jgi:hypothetical protein
MIKQFTKLVAAMAVLLAMASMLVIVVGVFLRG